MKRIFFILLFLVGLVAIAFWQHERIPFLRDFFHEAFKVQQYTCPMHPQIIRDKPGVCPICGMKLVPLEKKMEPDHEHPAGAPAAGAFYLEPSRRQLIGVKMSPVETKELQREIRLPGRVAYDSELYITEKEYGNGLVLGIEGEILQTIEKKLTRLGISKEELEKLKRSRQADDSLFLPKEGSSFWIYASVYESDLSWISAGMKAQVYLPKDKGIFLEGEVKQVTPVVDPMTRTAVARIFVAIPKFFLKPETYVDCVLKKDLGKSLAIPEDAVIETGVKQVVFVDLGEGYLEPREVRLGLKAGPNYPVLEGLREGEKVVTSAHFLLDSEANLQTALKKFGAAKMEHHH